MPPFKEMSPPCATQYCPPPQSRGRGSRLSWLAALWFSVLVCGCGEDRPPPAGSGGDAQVGLRDGGVGAPDAAFDAAPPPRPAAPVLPGADTVVSLPFQGAPVQLELRVGAALAQLDVHLSVDTTGSFGDEIDQMQSALDDRIIPALEKEVPDVAFGVSRFEDFGRDPYGAPGDVPYQLLTAITTVRTRVAAAVSALDDPLGNGGDIPESGFEALYQIATGDGYRLAGSTIIPPASNGGSTVGGVGFRAGAFHTVVHITDAPSHNPADYTGDFPGTRGQTEVITAAQDIDLRILGVASGLGARPQLEALAVGSGALVPATDGSCATGIGGAPRPATGDQCPLVFDIAGDGSGLSDAVVDAIVDLLGTVVFDEVFGVVTGDRLQFLESIVPTTAVVEPGTVGPGIADLRPPAGTDDTFTSVRPGTELVFQATLQNNTIPAADYDQVFRLEVQLFGDGLVLRSETVRIVVPRETPDGGA